MTLKWRLSKYQWSYHQDSVLVISCPTERPPRNFGEMASYSPGTQNGQDDLKILSHPVSRKPSMTTRDESEFIINVFNELIIFWELGEISPWSWKLTIKHFSRLSYVNYTNATGQTRSTWEESTPSVLWQLTLENKMTELEDHHFATCNELRDLAC